MTPVLTREDELCLLLARGQLIPEERTRVLEFLATPLQWPLLLERAYSHQVYPLLYRNLLDLGFPGVPEASAGRTERPLPGQRATQPVAGGRIGPVAQFAGRRRNTGRSA